MKIIKKKRMLKLLEKAGFCMWGDETWKPEGATVCWDCDYDKEIRKYTKLVVKEVITEFAKSVEAKLKVQTEISSYFDRISSDYDQIRGEKPLVKSYCGGKPNYCTPIDAVNMSQERVDETAKGEHEPVGWGSFFFSDDCNSAHKADKSTHEREWVGLTRQEFEECVDGLEDLEDCWVAIEAKLKEKNTCS